MSTLCCLWQVSASVVRNLSWRADASCKEALREAGTATALMQAAMMSSTEQTLKSILSALWNVSAHCVENKAAVCVVPGALEFLVGLLEYCSPSKSLAVVENAGGILRNMSSFVALHEDHRRTLRQTGIYQLLLRQLRSPSLTVVSNACGSLWNLSARCLEDQQRLRDLGAVGLLRSLVNSKHKMIAMGSTAALKNLLVPRSTGAQMLADSRQFEKTGANQTTTPGLHTRRQRSLDRDFERHSDIGEFTGPQRQSFGITSQPNSGWVMSSSAGGNLFPSGGSGRVMMTDQLDESGWRRPRDQTNMKIPNSAGVAGSSSFKHVTERTFHDSQSVDNSPAVHRRVPVHGITAAVSSSLDYGQPVRNQMGSAYTGWSGGMLPSNGHSDASFDHFSRRMERVHFTDLPDCSQDEPINFSMKYKESTDTPNSQTVQRSSSSTAVAVDGDRMSTTQQPVLDSPITRFHISRQSLPNGRSHRPDFARSQTSQVASYSKSQFPAAVGIHFDSQKYAAAYGRSSMDVECPTNYSLQYAERYEDDECSGGQFSEQPIDYSTRYMEPQTCRPSVFRQDRDEQCGLYADTIKTFCTEGTPMNYQSTATSMTDLSNVKSNKTSEFLSHRQTHSSDDLDVDEVQDFSRKYSEPQVDDGRPNQNSTGHQAYRWPQQRTEVSAYLHRDIVTSETGASSPGERPLRYCTEGTPPEFSHSGSLNSLHNDSIAKSDVVHPAGSTTATNTGPTDDTFNKSNKTFSLQPAAGSGAGMSSMPSESESHEHGTVETKDVAHGKTVTFDVESNQVEETPLMFSRSSSLGSLSSFDVRSVHSSVVSEYSVRASQVVSPSELPDSPCNTMPPSPSAASKASQPAVFFGPDAAPAETADESHNQAANNNDVNTSSVLTDTADTSALTVQPLISSDQSSPVNYCSEGGNMSSRTSLSALTCDGEQIHLCKEPRSLPLGEEDGTDASAVVVDPRPNDSINDDDDDGVDSPVNEDDEKKLAECISLGMPPKRKKQSSRRMTRSRSDGECLDRQSNPSSSLLATTSTAAAVTTSASDNKIDATVKQPKLAVVEQPVLDSYDVDSPRQFATEDTPLNFSQSGSLSDLSSVRADVETKPRDVAASATVTKLHTTAAPDDDDSDVSLSDDDVPGGDELLSHLIEAAMPKKRQHWKPAMQTNNVRGRPPVGGPLSTDGTRRQVSRSLEPPVHRGSRNNPSQLREFHGLRSHLADARRQHDLSGKNTVPASTAVPRQPPTAADQSQLYNGATCSGAYAVKPPAFSWSAEPSEDHMLSYAVEGTPNSYSRDRSPTSLRIPNTMVNRSLSKTGDASWNSSLSSLSFDSSLNAEPTAEESALLQECINAALPKSRAKKSNKKSASGHQQPLRTSPSGSSESSYKHRPVNITSTKSNESKTGLDITEESKSQDVDVSHRKPELANSIDLGIDACCDIMQESLPDVGMLDVALDDESLPSGPSTEANNTVIYCGPALPEAGQSSSTVEQSDMTVAADSEGNTTAPTDNKDTDVVCELSTDVTQTNSGCDIVSADLSSDQVHLPR